MSLPVGKVSGESSSAYHGAEAISFSRLKTFIEDPALYRRLYVTRTLKHRVTPEMIDGRGIHALVLEGLDKFNREFSVRPSGIDKRTNVGKAEYAQWEAEAVANDREMIESAELMESVSRAVLEHPIAGLLFQGGEAEVTLRAKMPWLPVHAQCKMDYWHPNGCAFTGGKPAIIDLKTTASLDKADYLHWWRAFEELKYFRQDPFYRTLAQEVLDLWPDWIWVVAEKKYPWRVRVFRSTERAVARGMAENEADLQRLAKCYATAVWCDAEEIDLREDFKT